MMQHFKAMTQEEYSDLKQNYIDFIKEMMVEIGGLNPGITIMGTRKEDNINAVVHIPIPPVFMDSDQAKDKFFEEVIPELAPKINDKFNIEAVAWSSEAWVRKVAKGQEIPDNWKDLPKEKEVIIISIERQSDMETMVLEIIRNGVSVNEQGDLIDTIDLVEIEDMKNPEKAEGRFTGLYKRFTEFSAGL